MTPLILNDVFDRKLSTMDGNIFDIVLDVFVRYSPYVYWTYSDRDFLSRMGFYEVWVRQEVSV
ncbi:hypothetical protein CHS0354_005526 [Potamilus streckersoni]|uniref:Uncharacterized protein n=1 Tax=Potamilus streckersoni TaxID=2493646 RepID=A0AAE0VSJ2_9BIVA|nr:hypothetical protein CHS0354_005526 [Potamilus streckersoni]